VNKLTTKVKTQVRQLAKQTRFWRSTHYYLGLSLAVFLLISASTGLLLGWKKQSGLLQPPTQNGTSTLSDNWLTINQIGIKAIEAISRKVGHATYEIERIDIRPQKGVGKVLFKRGYWEVQIDLASGKVLSVEKRYSDLIEQIHDGSILSESFKFISMNALSIMIIFSIFSGLWMWYGPRRIRKFKRQ
jgi:uncharacterized iron-regulated membrane protein